MTFRKTCILALFLCSLVIPGFTNAFELLETQAYQITPDTYVFTIEFEAGYLNAYAFLPIVASYQSVVGEPHLTYTLSTDLHDSIPRSETVAVVLSDAPVQGEYYTIEAGERATFTLLVLYRGTDRPNTLAVTSLASVVNTGTSVSYIEASTEELVSYTVDTPATELTGVQK